MHAAPSRREFILPSRFPLVKPFFQVFQNFFRGFSREARSGSLPAALADDLFILPSLPRPVKYFFQIFFDLFCAQLRSGREFSAALADSLRRIPPPAAFVKHFFPLFCPFSSHTPFYPLRHLIEYDKMTCFPSGFPLLRTRNIAIPVYSYIGNGYLYLILI